MNCYLIYELKLQMVAWLLHIRVKLRGIEWQKQVTNSRNGDYSNTKYSVGYHHGAMGNYRKILSHLIVGNTFNLEMLNWSLLTAIDIIIL